MKVVLRQSQTIREGVDMRKPSLVAIWIVIAITMGFFGISLAGLDYTKYHPGGKAINWHSAHNRAENQVVTLTEVDDEYATYLHSIKIKGADASKFSVVSPTLNEFGTIEGGPVEITSEQFPVTLSYDSSAVGDHTATMEMLVESEKSEGTALGVQSIELRATTVAAPQSTSIEWVHPFVPDTFNEQLVSGTTYRIRWLPSADLVGFDIWAGIKSGEEYNWTKLNSSQLTVPYFDWYVDEVSAPIPNCKFKVQGYKSGSQTPDVEEEVLWNLGFVRIIFPEVGSSYGGRLHCDGTPIQLWSNGATYLTGYTPNPITHYKWEVSHNGISWQPIKAGPGNPGGFNWFDQFLLYADDETTWLRMGIYKYGGGLIDSHTSRAFTVTEGNQCD